MKGASPRLVTPDDTPFAPNQARAANIISAA
jgi:hypothetical protein